MKFTAISAAASLVVVPFCAAFEAPKQFVRTLEIEQDLKSQVFALSKNNNNGHQGRQLTDTCLACLATYDATSGGEENEQSGFIKTALAKAKSLTGEGSVFSSLKDALLASEAGALGEEVSKETVLPILMTAGSQFTALVLSTQQMKSAVAVSADTTKIVIAIFDLIEGIITAIADLIFQIIDLISSVATAVVGLIVGIIIAILNLIEDIILGIIAIIVNFINAIIGRSSSSVATDSTSAKADKLRDILSAGAIGGVFSDVMEFLAAEGDESGLITVLSNSAADMSGIEDSVTAFVELADAEPSDVTTIQADTIVQILDLIVSIIASILNLVISIITSVLNLIVTIITDVLNLIVGIISAIINLIVSILSSILGIFTLQADSTAVPSQTSLIMEILATLLGLPINLIEVAVCALNLPACSNVSAEEVGCQMEAVTCENNALAAAVATSA